MVEKNTENIPQFNYNDYPATFIASDRASQNAQMWFKYLNLGYYISLAITTLLVFVSSKVTDYKFLLDSLAMSVMVGGIILLYLIKARRYDKIWFDCRSIAESAKTMSWRYMMRINPYKEDKSDSIFIRGLMALRTSKHQSIEMLDSVVEISDKMKQIKSLNIEGKKLVYMTHRVNDQRKWYSTKSNESSQMGSRIYYCVFVLQLLAIFTSIFGLKENVILFAPLVLALIAFLVSWNNFRRYDELGISYNVACAELVSLENLMGLETNEEEFLELLEETEEAISREHTMWIAKRGV